MWTPCCISIIPSINHSSSRVVVVVVHQHSIRLLWCLPSGAAAEPPAPHSPMQPSTAQRTYINNNSSRRQG